MSSNYLFNGIHSDAKNDWLIALDNNCSKIKAAKTMCDRKRILDELANKINGISTNTVEKTLAEIESQHY